MNAKKRSIIIAISFILLTSIACELISSIAPSQSEDVAEILSTEESTEIPPTEDAALPAPTPQQDAQTSESESASETESSNTLVAPPPTNGGACANVLYPLIPGYQWVYEITSEGETSQIGITVTQVNENTATINALYIDTGITSEATIECQDGAIISFPTVLLGFIFGDAEGTLDIHHEDGVFIPNYQALVDHNWKHTWHSQYTASGVIEAEIDGDLITGRLQESPLGMDWNTLDENETEFAFDPITIKAGDFPQAIKLRRDTQLDFTAEMEEGGEIISLSAVLNIKNNLWFEPNMGLLKQEIEQASAKVYGISFPIVMDTTIELIEFRTEE